MVSSRELCGYSAEFAFLLDVMCFDWAAKGKELKISSFENWSVGKCFCCCSLPGNILFNAVFVFRYSPEFYSEVCVSE